MKKLILGGLAALAIRLAVAPVAGADSNDREFIKATGRVIMGGNRLRPGRALGSISRCSCSTQDRHRPHGVRHAGRRRFECQ